MGIKKAYIEIINKCNLSCDFCPAGNKNLHRALKIMTTEEFLHIIGQVRGLVDEVCLHVTGEPLMHPDLEKILELCNKNKIKVNITTNGILMGERAEILFAAKAIRVINVSLHSMINRGDFEEYLKRIIQFIHILIEKSSATCKLRLWDIESDSNEKIIQGHNSENRKMLYLKLEKEFNLGFKIDDSMIQLEGIRLARRVFLSQAERFEWPKSEDCSNNGICSEKQEKKRAFCKGLRNQFAILADGRVVPCCLDWEGNVELGNIFQENIKDILNGQRAKRIYEGFTEGKAVEDLCKKCSYRLKFI